MEGVSKRVRRSVALLALVMMFMAQSVVARESGREKKLMDRLENARQFIVKLLGRLSPPPGDEGE